MKRRILVTLVAILVVGSVAAVYMLIRDQSVQDRSARSQVPSAIGTSESSAHAQQASTLPQAAPTPAVTPPDYTIPPVTNGLAPVVSRLPTKEPVVFLGIDDGVTKLPGDLKMMQDNNIKASLFLTDRFIKDNPTFFKDFITAGSLVEDHTIDHKLLTNLSYDQQKQEICDQADLEQEEYGRRPILFRPPGGDYNTDTQRAAAACGMKAVIMWIAKANGGSMQYQVGHGLRAGDVVLMHFRPEFAQDMQSFIDASKQAGLHTELLEDWLAP